MPLAQSNQSSMMLDRNVILRTFTIIKHMLKISSNNLKECSVKNRRQSSKGPYPSVLCAPDKPVIMLGSSDKTEFA